MQKRWIQLGIVGKAHGLNGAFFISQREELLPEGVKSLRVGKDPERAQVLTVKACRWQGDRPLLVADEIKSRDAAELICHQPLWCERSKLAIEEDEEYLWGDLVGKEVIDLSGKVLGKIAEVYNYGASDIVKVVDGKERFVEIPFVPTYFSMDFSYEDAELKLLVPIETFDDTWNEA